MQKMKESFVVKVVAYILILLCMMVTVLSGILIYINASNQWYTKDYDACMHDIYQEMLEYACYQLDYTIASYESDTVASEETTIEDENGDVVASSSTTYDLKGLGDTEDELLYGERNADGFAYTITKPEKDQSGNVNTVTVREVHPELVKYAKESNGFLTDNIVHNDMTISVYMIKDPDAGNLPDTVFMKYRSMEKIYKYRVEAIVAAALCSIMALCLFIFMVTTVGRRKQEDERSILAKTPAEIVLLLACIAVMFTLEAAFGSNYENNFDMLCTAVAAATLVITSIALGAVLFLVIKLRNHNLWSSSVLCLLYRIIKWAAGHAKRFFGGFPLVWKTVLVVTVILLFNLAALGIMSGSAWFLWAGAIFVLAVLTAQKMKRLKEGGRHLAEGDLSYQIDTKDLRGDLLDHAENLNHIREGISAAVEEQMKSKRFRSELITNVSHDIKTPLTSIINYVDFLKKEEIDNEQAKEYIGVLDRQATRLKKLTEDLVEASKAATGNVKLEMIPCRVGVLMMQVMGEYKEKTEAADLTMIPSQPEEDLEILADGRSLWRVFDNLLNNICKYSQPGTRVYQTLERQDDKAVIIYRNVSAYELNTSEDELMERFVRGDKSRHTEGSGLGLSIAQNLVELQGGSFRIHIDGDLFKVIIEFPLYHGGPLAVTIPEK